MKLIRYQQPTAYSSFGNFSNLFEDALTSLGPLASFNEQPGKAARSPRVSYEETDSAFNFVFEIPGVSREDVNLGVEKNIITLSTGKNVNETEKENPEEATKETAVYYLSRVRLPRHVEVETAKASLENGVLTVSFSKAAKAQPRQIEIN